MKRSFNGAVIIIMMITMMMIAWPTTAAHQTTKTTTLNSISNNNRNKEKRLLSSDCLGIDCFNGGTCDSTTNSCICLEGFTGNLCQHVTSEMAQQLEAQLVQDEKEEEGEQPLSDTTSNTVDVVDTSLAAVDSPQAENSPCPLDCFNGGTCINDEFGTGAVCQCLEGFMGDRCEDPTPEMAKQLEAQLVHDEEQEEEEGETADQDDGDGQSSATAAETVPNKKDDSSSLLSASYTIESTQDDTETPCPLDCFNGGTCVNDEFGTGAVCQCLEGFMGDRCEHPTSDMAKQLEAQLVQDEEGEEGETADQDDGDGQSSTAAAETVPTKKDDSSSLLSASYSVPSLQDDAETPCPLDCFNGGTCINDGNEFGTGATCQCLEGFAGDRCEDPTSEMAQQLEAQLVQDEEGEEGETTDQDDGDEQPSTAAAETVPNKKDDSSSLLSASYSVPSLQDDSGKTSSSPCPLDCFNGGTCVNDEFGNGAVCQCLEGFMGDRCEDPTPEMAKQLEAQLVQDEEQEEGGSEEDQNDGDEQPSATSLSSITKDVPNEMDDPLSAAVDSPQENTETVSSSPCPLDCFNGGTCINDQYGNGAVCQCLKGFMGDRCEHPTSEMAQQLESQLVQDEEQEEEGEEGDQDDGDEQSTTEAAETVPNKKDDSSSLLSASYSVESTTQDDAETPCPLDCFNGGTCVNDKYGNGAVCQCLQGFMGDRCEHPTSEMAKQLESQLVQDEEQEEQSVSSSGSKTLDVDSVESPRNAIATTSSSPCPLDCFNSGTCIKNRNGVATCECPEGFMGKQCLDPTPEKAKQLEAQLLQDEQGQGREQPSTSSSSSSATRASTPKTSKSTPCPLDCFNGGTCIKTVRNGTTCQCPRDFTGKQCQNPTPEKAKQLEAQLLQDEQEQQKSLTNSGSDNNQASSTTVSSIPNPKPLLQSNSTTVKDDTSNNATSSNASRPKSFRSRVSLGQRIGIHIAVFFGAFLVSTLIVHTILKCWQRQMRLRQQQNEQFAEGGGNRLLSLNKGNDTKNSNTGKSGDNAERQPLSRFFQSRREQQQTPKTRQPRRSFFLHRPSFLQVPSSRRQVQQEQQQQPERSMSIFDIERQQRQQIEKHYAEKPPVNLMAATREPN